MAGLTYTFFFYGTLMDRAVLNLVSGTDFTAAQLRPAVLRDFRRLRVSAANYPGITVAAGCQVPGVIVRGLTPDAVTRLDRFENDRYDRQNLDVETSGDRVIKAAAYVASERMLLDYDEWDFKDWRTRHRRRYLDYVRDWACRYAE